MKTLSYLGLLGCGLLFALSAYRAFEAQDTAKAKAALKAIEAKLKSVKTNDRVEALRRLKEYPTTDGVDLIFERGLRDKQPDVRNAGLDTLFALKNDAARPLGRFSAAACRAEFRRLPQRAIAAEVECENLDKPDERSKREPSNSGKGT